MIEGKVRPNVGRRKALRRVAAGSSKSNSPTDPKKQAAHDTSERPPSYFSSRSAIIYIVSLSVFYAFVSFNGQRDTKLALVCLIIGAVSSQIIIDLAEFSSSATKVLFVVATRILMGVCGLSIIYFA